MNHPEKRIVPSDKLLVSCLYHSNVLNSVYSSILSVFRKHVKNLFPINYFKSEFIHNSIYAVTAATVDEDDSFVQERPNLAINMKYEPDDFTFAGDDFLANNMFIKRRAWLDPYSYSRIAWDRNKHIFISASPYRFKNSFEVTLTLNSEMQAINTYGYLRSRVGINRPVYLNKRIIEIPLPPSLIGTLAAARGYRLNDLGDIIKLNDTLTEISDGNITYKLHKTSGKYLYFLKYQTNILCTLTSLDSIEKENVDKTITKSSLKFTMTMEYDIFHSFILESYQNLPPVDNDNLNKYIVEDMGVGVMLHSTFSTPISSQLENGQKLAFNLDIVTDIDTYIDETSFKDIIHRDNLEFFEHLKKESENDDYEVLKKNVTSLVYCDGIELKEGEDYIVNWKDYTLKINYPKSNFDYKFIIYANMLLANQYHTSKDSNRNI